MGNDSHNVTDDFNAVSQSQYRLTAMQTASLVMYCVIFVAGTIGNGLVIYVTGFKMKKTVNSIWFLNLALADFIFTAFLIFTMINTSRGYDWPFGDLMCKLNSLMTVINMFASIFLLMSISLDRCLATWVVVWAQNKRTPRKAEFMCVCVWMAAVACSLPYSISREVIQYGDMSLCAYSQSANIWSLTVLRFVAGFAIPFLVIIVSYVAINVRARRLQRGKKKRRSLRIIISIILAFFICWMPFHVFQFLLFNSTVMANQAIRDFVQQVCMPLSTNLAFLNSCINPVLYVFMCDEFQKKLQQSVCHVLESALAEDALSFASSRSLASHLSRISRKSDSVFPGERKNTGTSFTTTSSDNKEAAVAEKEALHSEQDF